MFKLTEPINRFFLNWNVYVILSNENTSFYTLYTLLANVLNTNSTHLKRPSVHGIRKIVGLTPFVQWVNFREDEWRLHGLVVEVHVIFHSRLPLVALVDTNEVSKFDGIQSAANQLNHHVICIVWFYVDISHAHLIWKWDYIFTYPLFLGHVCLI